MENDQLLIPSEALKHTMQYIAFFVTKVMCYQAATNNAVLYNFMSTNEKETSPFTVLHR